MIKWIDFTGISVSTLVYHPEQWFLFWHRTDQCRDERRKRDNRGGGLKFWEEISDGMKRELEEEFWRTFKDNQIYTLWYREQFREHNGKQSHRIAFYHITILDGTETITNMEPHKHDELKYFPIDKLPTQAESHSMLYPKLIEFKGKIEELIWKKVVL